MPGCFDAHSRPACIFPYHNYFRPLVGLQRTHNLVMWGRATSIVPNVILMRIIWRARTFESNTISFWTWISMDADSGAYKRVTILQYIHRKTQTAMMALTCVDLWTSATLAICSVLYLQLSQIELQGYRSVTWYWIVLTYSVTLWVTPHSMLHITSCFGASYLVMLRFSFGWRFLSMHCIVLHYFT